MTDSGWSSAGLATDTIINSGNVNAPGNALAGGYIVTYITPTGTPDVIARRPSGVPGVGISSDVTTEVMRWDLRHAADASNDAAGQAIQFVFQAPGGGPSVDQPLTIGRSAAGFSSYIYHRAVNDIQIRNSLNVNVTSSVSGSATTAASPVMVAGNRYQLDIATMNNTSVSPTISNGRIMARVRDLTNPAAWNGGNEWYMDTGYTANVSNTDPTSLQQYTRFLKPLAGATFAEQLFTGIRWKNIGAPVTSLTKASAIANFVQPAGPAVGIGDTGPGYIINAIGSPVIGGGISYAIAASSGTSQVPVQLATGIWKVTQGANALGYDVTVTEAGGGSTVQHYDVPAVVATAGQFFRSRWDAATSTWT